MTVHIKHDLDLFSTKEVDSIVEYGDSLILEEGRVKDERVDHSIRNSKIAWIHPKKETLWLFSKAIKVFQSSLPFSTLQSMQYSLYYGTDKSHYTWHRDIGDDEIAKARVNVGVLQLSSPGEYKGGVLQIKLEDGEVIDVMKNKGMTTTFPINLLHKVSPVTSGIRKTLIMWGLV